MSVRANEARPCTRCGATPETGATFSRDRGGYRRSQCTQCVALGRRRSHGISPRDARSQQQRLEVPCAVEVLCYPLLEGTAVSLAGEGVWVQWSGGTDWFALRDVRRRKETR